MAQTLTYPTAEAEVQTGLKETFDWNQRKALSYLLSIEEHMAELTQEEIPHSWCNVKHYLLAVDHHCLECIGHAERLGMDASKYRRFRRKLLDLNMYPQPHVSIPDVVKLRTEWRYLIGDPTLGVECPICDSDVTPEIKRLIQDLEETENPLSLPEIEEQTAWRMVRHLSSKYNVPPPREIKFTEACNPMLPTAVHIQRDTVDLLSQEVTPRPELDVLVFCRGGVTAFAVAHEFKHYFDHVKGRLAADEGKANEFAIQETRNMLYTTVAENKGLIRESRNRLAGKGMAIDRKKGLAVLVGLGTAKVVDMYTPQLEGALGAYATMGKVAIGAGLMWAGLTRKVKGVVGDVVTFAGGALLINELFKFLPGVTPAARAVVAAPVGAPIAIPGAPGRAVITAASPYQRMWQTPTRLTGGYPQVAQVDSKWIQIRV